MVTHQKQQIKYLVISFSCDGLTFLIVQGGRMGFIYDGGHTDQM